MTKHVLITGGAGFIGSHLAEFCLSRGDIVDVIDDLSTGSIHNIEHLEGHPSFGCTIGAVEDEAITAKLVDRADIIFHLAAAVGVRLVVESPLRTIESNIGGTEIVLKLASRKRKRVLVASTSEVYGLSTDLPFREDGHLVLGATTLGRWSYACSKAIDECLAIAYWHEKELPATVVRIFNTVGPRQTSHYGMVVPTLVTQALAGHPLTVYGDGTQSRCFGYVLDVVRALAALMDHPDAVGEIVNIGSTEEVTILELANRVRAMTGSRSPVVMVPYEAAYRQGFEDMPRRVPDVSKLERLIGFRATTTLDEILRSVIDHHAGGQVPGGAGTERIMRA